MLNLHDPGVVLDDLAAAGFRARRLRHYGDLRLPSGSMASSQPTGADVTDPSSTLSSASLPTASGSARFEELPDTRARVSEPALPLLLATIYEELARPIVVLAPEDADARDAAEAAGWLGDERVALLPSRGVSRGSGLEPPPHLVGERARALDVLAAGGPRPARPPPRFCRRHAAVRRAAGPDPRRARTGAGNRRSRRGTRARRLRAGRQRRSAASSRSGAASSTCT